MEIKSSLVNEESFSEVKKSLIAASEIDGKEKFRVRMLEYINDTADNSNDMFFYDMLEFSRFLHPNEESIAYTDTNRLIYLNAPGKPGESVRLWDFIYCHECLHQLWDTFGVGEKIQKEGIEYNHNLLNIASDCVINDYLSYNRKKEMFENGISPKYLEEKFGVKYDRTNDTQYSLYLKLLPKTKDIEKDPICQKSFDDKIKPKSVEKIENGGDNPMPPEKHSPDYIKGWTDAIQDTLDKKVDPLDEKRKPSNTGNDEYDKGYEDCIIQIKKGLEKGIQMSNSASGGKSGDLPEIPWDIDNDSNDSDNSNNDSKENNDESADDAANRAQKAADSAKKKANSAKSNNDSNADDLEKAAQEAQKEADKAKDAAEKAKDAVKKGDKKEADKQNKLARSAADKAEQAAGESSSNSSSLSNTVSKAKDAAKEARDAANKAKEMAKSAKGSSDAKEKQENAEAAEKHAKEAEDAAKEAEKEAKAANSSTGKKSEQHKEAAEKAAERAEEAAAAAKAKIGEGKDESNKEPSKGAGTGSDRTVAKEQDVDIDQITKKANEIIEKYRNKISGVFGEFINKCKASKELKKSGLAVNVQQGGTGWNSKLNQIVNQYVKRKVFKAKQRYEQTYHRIKRGSGFINYGDPIQPGVKRKNNLMTINVAFYLDISGSMGNSVNYVFDATYIIAEALKKHFAREKVVSDISFKIFAFNEYFQEIKYGKRCGSNGSTMSFEKLLSGIKDRTNDHLINIIITDAEFSSITETKVNDFLDEIAGLVVFVTNNNRDDRVKKIAQKHPNKLEYILADSNFVIDK